VSRREANVGEAQKILLGFQSLNCKSCKGVSLLLCSEELIKKKLYLCH